MGSISAICPKRWTGITAFVFSVIAFSIFAGSMLYVSGLMSTKTGFAPRRAIEPAVAKKVKGVVITSSPGPMSSDISTERMASVPLETPTANLQSDTFVIWFSSCSTFGPPIDR